MSNAIHTANKMLSGFNLSSVLDELSNGSLSTYHNLTHSLGIHSKGIIYASVAEKWLTFLYLVAVIIIVVAFNSGFILVVYRFQRFHTVHFVVLICYALCDLTYNLCSAGQFLLSWARGSLQSDTACRIFSAVGIGALFNVIYHCGLIAFERYVFFLHPLHYNLVFSKRNLFFYVAAFYILCYTYIGFTEIYLERVFYPAAMVCMLQGPSYHSLIHIAIFFIPSLTMTVYGTVRTWRLASKLRVGPVETADMARKASIKTAIRLVLLISGAYWGTYIPSYFIHTILNNLYTEHQLNFRYNTSASITYRIAIFCLAHLSSIFNPIIYFFTNRHLFIGLKILLGLANDFPKNDDEVDNKTHESTT